MKGKTFQSPLFPAMTQGLNPLKVGFYDHEFEKSSNHLNKLRQLPYPSPSISKPQPPPDFLRLFLRNFLFLLIILVTQKPLPKARARCGATRSTGKWWSCATFFLSPLQLGDDHDGDYDGGDGGDHGGDDHDGDGGDHHRDHIQRGSVEVARPPSSPGFN